MVERADHAAGPAPCPPPAGRRRAAPQRDVLPGAPSPRRRGPLGPARGRASGLVPWRPSVGRPSRPALAPRRVPARLWPLARPVPRLPPPPRAPSPRPRPRPRSRGGRGAGGGSRAAGPRRRAGRGGRRAFAGARGGSRRARHGPGARARPRDRDGRSPAPRGSRPALALRARAGSWLAAGGSSSSAARFGPRPGRTSRERNPLLPFAPRGPAPRPSRDAPSRHGHGAEAVSDAIATVEAEPGRVRALVQGSLAGFDAVSFRVTGDCMRPALAPGDVVRVAGARPPPAAVRRRGARGHGRGLAPSSPRVEAAPLLRALAHQGRPRAGFRRAALSRKPRWAPLWESKARRGLRPVFSPLPRPGLALAGDRLSPAVGCGCGA